jgi:hypothetical protein
MLRIVIDRTQIVIEAFATSGFAPTVVSDLAPTAVGE